MKYNVMYLQFYQLFSSTQLPRCLFVYISSAVYIENCADLASVVGPASFSLIKYMYSVHIVIQSYFVYLKIASISFA